MDNRKVDLVDTEPYRFQCKHEESSKDLHKLLQEMEDNRKSGEDGMNVVLHKRNRKGTIVALTLEDFLKIIQ